MVSFPLSKPVSLDDEFPFGPALKTDIRRELIAWADSMLPSGTEKQAAWVLANMHNSTGGLGKDRVSENTTQSVLSILKGVRVGQELEHLKQMYSLLELRGSDVRLEIGVVLDGSRQVVPYPAMAWDWVCIQSYAWKAPQYINVLELIAFLNFLRAMSTRKGSNKSRFLHVLDSRICSCVVAKGRSSSRMFNCTLRRVASILLCGELYALSLWTISA